MPVSLHLLARIHIDDYGIMLWQRIARLGVFLLVEDRLQLVGRRRLHVVGVTLGHGHTLAYEDALAIGTPLNAVAVIAAYGTILRQDSLRLGVRFAGLVHHHVVAFNVGLQLAVGRKYGIGILLLIHLHPVALFLSAKLRFPFRALLQFQRLLHFLVRGVGMAGALSGIEGNIFSALRGRDFIVQHIRRIAPGRVLCPVENGISGKCARQRVSLVVTGHHVLAAGSVGILLRSGFCGNQRHGSC